MRNNKVWPICLAALLTASSVLPAYGAVGPGQAEKPIPEGITAEQWNGLNDNTIEFEELSNLVRYYNPDLQNLVNSINANVENLEYVYGELTGIEMKDNIKNLEDQAKALKPTGVTDENGIPMYQILEGTVKGIKSNTEKMQRTIKKLKQPNSAINSGITEASRKYEYYADQIMIGYNSAVANQALLQKATELSNSAYEAQQLGLTIGTATQTDVLSAKKELLSAQSSLLSLNHTVDGLRRSLGLMTGYSADASPEIGGLPELDMQQITAIDLEADTAKAIGNNYELIKTRRTNSNKTTVGIAQKQADVSEGEQNVAVTMQSFYQNLKQAKTAYEAALTSFEKAGLDKGKAERSFQMGMLSKITYLQTQMGYLQTEGAKESAYSELYQAYTTYQWAVKGVIIDSGNQ
ncbi:TolC family protein [Lacrimispora xylanolytica]|uniref:TolC family protein n=1 Tax=Lacrimispora xylanolytica TaxID=29375 RepID=A0ABY7A9Z2_9FIRM|nr:TolC family protein [Lacrimispora xylanolytica]WAJ23497.1 TolC family protein [Lacrimispora xylanolytica]